MGPSPSEIQSWTERAASQSFARGLRAAASRGVVYPSVRDAGGECRGAFTPRAVGLPTSTGVLRYHWDGDRIDRVFDYATDRWL